MIMGVTAKVLYSRGIHLLIRDVKKTSRARRLDKHTIINLMNDFTGYEEMC